MTAYASKAQIGRAFLFQQYNDIDVYVEDTTCQNLWLRLLRAIAGPKARIEAVFPLGGKTEVVRAASGDSQVGGRPRLYVVDGDLDLMAGSPMPTQERLFILPVYSIENLVLLESAILEVATDGLVDSSIARARDTLGPAKLLESVSRALLPLFAVYGIAHSLKLPIETVSFPVQRLCDDGNDISTLSGKRIRTRMRQVLAEVANRVDLDLYRSEADRVKQILRVATDTQRYISGKSYLLPSIHIHLRKHAAFRGSQDELKARLARHYEPETEPGLSARIRGLLSESEAA